MATLAGGAAALGIRSTPNPMEDSVAGMVHVRVCIGMNCSFSGGLQLLEALESDERIAKYCEITSSRCVDDHCRGGQDAPVVEIDGRILTRASLEVVTDLLLERCRELENHV